jgi:hypothetical protein
LIPEPIYPAGVSPSRRLPARARHASSIPTVSLPFISLRSVLTTSEYHYFRFLVQLGTLSPPWPGFSPYLAHYLTIDKPLPSSVH